MIEPITAKQLARMFKSNGRTVRKFLRRQLGPVGQGSRWEIKEEDLPELRKAWEEWRTLLEQKANKEHSNGGEEN